MRLGLVLSAILAASACQAPPAQPAADVATLSIEGAELADCIVQAKAHDGGFAYYEGCRDAVMRTLADGGVE